MQTNTCIVLHKIFSIQAVNSFSTSEAQQHQIKLCCFLLRIGLFLACFEGDLYAVKFGISHGRQKRLKEMPWNQSSVDKCQTVFWKWWKWFLKCHSYRLVLLLDPGHEVWCLDPLTGNTGPKWRSMTLSLPGLTSPRPSLPRCVCVLYVFECVLFDCRKNWRLR